MTKGHLVMVSQIWISVAAAAALALAGCVEAPGEAVSPEATSTATEQLSVFDWSSDALMSGYDSVYEPAVASINGLAVAVYAFNGVPDYKYLYWGFSSSGENWTTVKRELSPRASTTARPTLVPFNNFLYLFYASGVDQYMARFDPVHQTWTGSTRLPFDSLGAVAATPYNGALALIRTDPDTKQLFLRFMSTDESFSTETGIQYNTIATDPCAGNVIIIGHPGPSATIGSAASPNIGVTIGFWLNETSSSTVAMTSVGNCLYVAHLNGTTNTLVYNTFTLGSWGALRTVTAGSGGAAQTSSVQPAIANTSSGLQMVHIGPASTYGDIFWTTLSNGVWSAPLTIPNHQSQGTPSLAFHDNAKLLMMHLGSANGTNDLWSSHFIPTTP